MREATLRRERDPVDYGMCERLRTARVLGGITGHEVDRLAGLSKGHTSIIEAGTKTNMEMRTATSIATVLGLSLDWLLRGVGAPPTKRSVRTAIAVARLHRQK